MLLTLLFVVGICFAEATAWKAPAAPFEFRENCYMMHLENKYFATCNGENIEERNITLDSRATQHMSGIDFSSFLSITFDSSVHIPRISVSKTPRVSLFLSNPELKDLMIDSVDELTLRYKHARRTAPSKITNMSLNNVNTLRLISDKEFVWSIKSINLTNVGDVDPGSSLLKIIAEHVTITKSNIRLNNKASLVLRTASGSIDKSVLYINKDGFINVTVSQFTVKDSNFFLEDGHINLINSKEVLFSKNSLYGFNNRPLSVHGNTATRFEANEIFTRDIVSVLSLSEQNVIFKDNSFDCNHCSEKSALLASDLQDTGDVNYCYSKCNLTLNALKTYLAKSCLCIEGEPEVDQDRLCITDVDCPKTLTDFNLLRWLLFISIPVVLIISLVFCIFHKYKKKRLKSTAINNVIPQDLMYERPQQVTAFHNICYDNIDNLQSHYEEVEPISCR